MKKNNIPTNNRLSYIDILKGIGIILVVAGHVYMNSIAYNWFYSFHMPLFFFAAGWVYKERPIKTDLRKRAKSIIIPYFSFGFLILLYWQLFERHFRASELSFTQSLFGLLIGEQNYLDFNAHLWFLPCFFMLTVFYNILINACKRISNSHKTLLTFLIAFTMTIIGIIRPLPALPWGIDRLFTYIIFFATGNIISKAISQNNNHLIGGGYTKVYHCEFVYDYKLLPVST